MNQLIVQRNDTNLKQEIFTTNTDKAKLVLTNALGKIEGRNAWQTPLGILVALLIARYRFLKQRGLSERQLLAPQAHKKFEAELSNQIWQAYMLFGPWVQRPKGDPIESIAIKPPKASCARSTNWP
jgi:hypothetical protein